VPTAQYTVTEVALDEGRPVEVTFADHKRKQLPVVSLSRALTCLVAYKSGHQSKAPSTSSKRITRSSKSTSRGRSQAEQEEDTAAVAAAVAAASGLFGSDNRMGLPNSLHRISAIRDRRGGICGLTYRLGRHLPGVGRLVMDVLLRMKATLEGGRPESLLLLGKPGVGKTTLLRDVARLLSEDPEEGGLGLRVVVVDTSNEIAGDGAVPHSCIGRARRMMVSCREEQASVLVEAVQNHSPQVVIVDEIGTRRVSQGAEARARGTASLCR
jgi:stage III sporulation protein SpoIIIAA